MEFESPAFRMIEVEVEIVPNEFSFLDTYLMGFKGKSVLDTGYIYAPYSEVLND